MSSVYRPKFRIVSSESAAASGEHIDTRAIRDDGIDWTKRRKANPANVLLPRTRLWLEQIPEHMRPYALAKQFPRLANLIAASWGNPGECTALLDSLLNDDRPFRQGFPHDVAAEIVGLRVGYQRLHPLR